jgi:hypothetical protein
MPCYLDDVADNAMASSSHGARCRGGSVVATAARECGFPSLTALRRSDLLGLRTQLHLLTLVCVPALTFI